MLSQPVSTPHRAPEIRRGGLRVGLVSAALALVAFALPATLAAAGSIVQVSQDTAHPQRFGRVDFTVSLAAPFTNPFDQADIALDFVARTPGHATLRLPCYFESGDAQASVWKARFTPQEMGAYRYHFELSVGGQPAAASSESVFASAPGTGDGFIHAGNYWTFVTDSGRVFRGIGENVGWESRSWEDPNYNYNLFLPELAANGANFFRTWMAPWNLPLEYHTVADTNRYSNSPDYFNPSGIARMDQLVTLAESLHLRMMLTLDEHGPFLPWDKWSINNYNSANGGPVAQPWDFFTNPAAKAMYKNRLRYIVARWGYSTSIGAWELFNEIDNVSKPLNIADSVITSWHDEMSTYLKQIDPYRHLVTTSISWQEIAGLNTLPNIDFNQKHVYNYTWTIPSTLGSYTLANAKPYVIGEFAFDWDWNNPFLPRAADFDFDYKRGLWYGLFSPTPILPMSWWWEFFHEQGVVPYMKNVRVISDRMLNAAPDGNFISVPVTSPTLERLGVKCGDTTFVYVLNSSGYQETSTVSTPMMDRGAFSVQVLDPATGTWTNSDDVQASGGTLKIATVTLNNREERVFIVTPHDHRDGWHE